MVHQALLKFIWKGKTTCTLAWENDLRQENIPATYSFNCLSSSCSISSEEKPVMMTGRKYFRLPNQFQVQFFITQFVKALRVHFKLLIDFKKLIREYISNSYE